MTNVCLKLSYDGVPFNGFARQPEQLTVQGDVEEALSKIYRRDVTTVCAGRTDAGVHAREQVVNFLLEENEDETEPFNERSLLRSLNALTHDAISVKEARLVEESFSARFSAKQRVYKYFIFNETCPPIFSKNFSWHVPAVLDMDAMKEAATYLIGEQDFKSFCLAASAEGKTTMRNVSEVSFNEECFFGENLISITISGNAFLHSMVRAIVGSLVLVGKGKRQPEWIKDVIYAKDRKAAGENAPACGLILWDVLY